MNRAINGVGGAQLPLAILIITVGLSTGIARASASQPVGARISSPRTVGIVDSRVTLIRVESGVVSPGRLRQFNLFYHYSHRLVSRSGWKFVGVQWSLTNTGEQILTGDANGETTLRGPNHAVYKSARTDVSSCTMQACVWFGGGAYRVKPSSSVEGWVVFQIPDSEDRGTVVVHLHHRMVAWKFL